MKYFQIQFSLLTIILTTQLIYSQNFVDDIYFNDNEVDYSFLYTDDVDYDGDNYDGEEDNLDQDISYEDRIKKFHNPYYFDYYWDYGWHSPHWYWNSPWSWNLNYHHYGWGNSWNYGWYNPWNHGGHYGHHHYYDHFDLGYVISTGTNHNLSYGHRDSQNTQVNTQVITGDTRDKRNLNKNSDENSEKTYTHRARKNNSFTTEKDKQPLDRIQKNKKPTRFGKLINEITKQENWNNYSKKESGNNNYKSSSNKNRNFNSNRSSNRSSNKSSNRSFRQ